MSIGCSENRLLPGYPTAAIFRTSGQSPAVCDGGRGAALTGNTTRTGDRREERSFGLPAGSFCAAATLADNQVATGQRRELVFVSVMSASIKPRLAGRQPSNRGGGAPGEDRVEQSNGDCRQARVRVDGPPDTDGGSFS